MALQDSLDKLQILLIELEYAIADVKIEASEASKLSERDFLFLQERALIADNAVHNLILVAQKVLSEINQAHVNARDDLVNFQK